VNFFINRPIFAAAIALMMVLGGVISMLVLPVAQYPPLVPPQIQVVTKYTGASAAVVANTVTTPLEEQLNGSEGMIYMASNSTNNGDSVITATYEVGFDQALAQMDVLTRSNQALSQLPPEVKQVGLTINKQSSNIVLIVNLVSPKGTFDQRFLQNYADIHITDRLARIEGVASIKNFGLAKYAMRVWLDPQRLANMGMTASRTIRSRPASWVRRRGPSPMGLSRLCSSCRLRGGWKTCRSLRISSSAPRPMAPWCGSRMSPASSWGRRITPGPPAWATRRLRLSPSSSRPTPIRCRSPSRSMPR
jgi:hypothetical protein